MTHFDPELTSCPVCESPSLKQGALRSNKGFLSLSNVDHSLCLDCRSYFVNPQPTSESLNLFYRSEVTEDVVEGKILNDSVNRYFHEDKREYFLQNRVHPVSKYLKSGCSILDVGCGAGVFVRFMKDLGYRAEGIDLSSRSIEFGWEKLHLGGDIRVGHWSEETGRTYELISAWTLIEHLKDPRGFLKTMAQRLCRGGVVLVEFPTVDSLLFRHLKENFFWVMPFYHLFLFSRKGMRKMFEQCGFSIVEEHNMPRNWYFFTSVCRSLGIEDGFYKTMSQVSEISKRIDEIFDDIALGLGESSTVQFICRKEP